jgi:2-polyprenyl-6-hydroxyphenyl methylase/3-demethylubiquinone-9 3-methyltransferase
MTPPPQNSDPREIAKFERLAPSWWDRSGDLRALHAINGLRVDYIDGRAGLKGKRVADVGCGGGILSEAMAFLGAEVTGIDMGGIPLEVARRHARRTGLAIRYVCAPVEDFAAANPQAFDMVTCLELLEHVPDPASIVNACRGLVKEGGDVFFATLNRNLKSFFFAIVGAEYVLRLVKPGTHSYRRFVRPRDLRAWAEACGLRPKHITGLHYHPLTGKYSLGGNTHVNYLVHFTRPKRAS